MQTTPREVRTFTAYVEWDPETQLSVPVSRSYSISVTSRDPHRVTHSTVGIDLLSG